MLDSKSKSKAPAVSPARLALAGAMALGVLANWYALTADIAPQAPAAAQLPAQLLGGPTVEASAPPASLGEAFQARPLFFAGRRPALPKDAEPQAASDGADITSSIPEQIQLAGIAREAGRPDRALIRFGAMKGSWVEVGQLLQGWRVSEIAPQAVVLEGEGQRRTIALSRSK